MAKSAPGADLAGVGFRLTRCFWCAGKVVFAHYFARSPDLALSFQCYLRYGFYGIAVLWGRTCKNVAPY